MKINRILVGIVVLLVLVNCLALSLLWMKVYPSKSRQMPLPLGPAFEYLSKELKLSPAQKSQYGKMRNAHAHFTDSINTQTRMMRDSFFDGLKTPAIKPEVINALEKRISSNLSKLDTATFYHFRKFRAILNTSQQQRFDDVIQQVIHSMAGAPPRRPRGNGTPQQGPSPQGIAPDRPPGKDDRPYGPPPRPGDRRGNHPGPAPGSGPPPDRNGLPPMGPPPNGGSPPGGPPSTT